MSASAHLAQIKHDIVETIRKVVDVVSRYAGAALPEQARRYVKQSILGLPVKWASAIEVRAGRRSRETSVGTVSMGGVESDLGTPRPDPHVGTGPESAGGKTPTQAGGMSDADMYELSPTEDVADRVLTFAVESLDMLRAVTGIFGESIEKAEACVSFLVLASSVASGSLTLISAHADCSWIERLRVIGVDRQRQRQAAHDDEMLQNELPALPAPADDPDHAATSTAMAAQTSSSVKKRRRGSGQLGSPGYDTAMSHERSSGMSEDGDEAGAARRMRRDD